VIYVATVTGTLLSEPGPKDWLPADRKIASEYDAVQEARKMVSAAEAEFEGQAVGGGITSLR